VPVRPVPVAREVVLEVLLGPDGLRQDPRVRALVLQRLRIDALQELDRVVVDVAPQVRVDRVEDAAELVAPAPPEVLGQPVEARAEIGHSSPRAFVYSRPPCYTTLVIGILPGGPEPRGATWDAAGTNFAVWCDRAHRVELCLFDAAGE